MLNENNCIRCGTAFFRAKGIGTPVFSTRKYCSQSCARKNNPKFGSEAANWKGGKPICKCGTEMSYGGRQCSKCYVSLIRQIPPKRGIPNSNVTRRRISAALTGRTLSPQHLQKLFGRKPWNYLEDRTALKRYGDDAKDRRSPAYANCRKQVRLRDNFTCKIANPDCSGRIEAHHILSWSDHPKLRYQINNGITLCHAHHPRVRAEEKRLQSDFQALVSVS